MTASKPLLEISGVGKRYGAQQVLEGIALDVPQGSRTAIVGPSGSGKTTLLRIIAGFEAPDTGTVSLAGQLMAQGPAIVPAHRRGIGFVPQDGALFPHLDASQNIGFGLPRGLAQRDARIAELMDIVELDRALATRRPHELSGGQQQRVALARALARKPALMLLDEPFSALDTGLRDTVRKSVARVLEAAGITAIMVTHDQAEALSFADQVAVLRQGRLAQVGSPRELYLRPADRETATFLGEATVMRGTLGDGCVDCALGRLVANTAGRRGPGEIMLRPEQILLDDSPAALGREGCYGTVETVEFGGAMCNVLVSVADGPQILVRRPSVDLPALGSRMRITICGTAHVMEPPPVAAVRLAPLPLGVPKPSS